MMSPLTVLTNEIEPYIQKLWGVLHIAVDLAGVLQDLLALVDNLVKEAAHDITADDNNAVLHIGH